MRINAEIQSGKNRIRNEVKICKVPGSDGSGLMPGSGLMSAAPGPKSTVLSLTSNV